MNLQLFPKKVDLTVTIYNSALVRDYFNIRKDMGELYGGRVHEDLKSLYQIHNDHPKYMWGIIVPSRQIYESITYEEKEPLTMTEIFVKHKEKYK